MTITIPERRDHIVYISSEGRAKERECFCLATNGFEHDERDSPWVTADGTYERREGIEAPPNPPFRTGEEPKDYRDRVAKAAIWDECVREMSDLGWLHDAAKADGLARNPYLDHCEPVRS